MDYSQYLLEDFVTDETFRNWVLAPSPELDQYWKDYIRIHPAQREIIAKARLLVAALQPQEPIVSAREQQEEWERLQTEVTQTNKLPVRPLWRQALRVASAIVLLLCAIPLGWWLISFPEKISYKTPYGKTQRILLPDSSTVVLNANSHLHFVRHWQPGAAREVWLEGEAYFEVKKQTSPTRFTVHADKLDVEVLGTQFTVLNRVHKHQVVLQEGRVQVKLPADSTIGMRPGELVELRGDSRISKRQVDAKQYKAWLEKKIIFKATPLREVALTIKDIYGYQVEFTDPTLADKQLTAILSGENLDVLLNGLQETFALNIQRKNRSIIIQSKSSQPNP